MSAAAAAPLDVRRFIDERTVSPYQWLILALCSIVTFVDGFDTAAMAFVAPSLSQAWSIPRSAMGPVMSAALVGMALGGLVAGPVGDRCGRKGVMDASVLLFGASTLICAHAGSIQVMTVLRLAAGFGFGAAIPNAAALLAEYAPERRRSLMVSFMFCAMTFGNACSGFIAAQLIPHYGWRSLFYLGGVIPLVLAAVLWAVLPESARFMVALGRPKEEIAAILARIAPGARAMLDAVTTFALPAPAAREIRHPIRTVMTPPLLLGTLMLWVVFFMGLVAVYLLTSWLPTMFRDAGFSLQAAANLSALFQLGGTAGAMLVAWGMGKIGPHRAIALAYLIAGIAVFALSRSLHSVTLLAFAVLAAGFFTSGAQTPVVALATGFYPTPARSTGVGWMLGVGRMGAVTGSFIGAPLLGVGLGFTTIVAALTVPLALAAAFVATLGVVYANRAGGGEGEPRSTAALTPQQQT